MAASLLAKREASMAEQIEKPLNLQPEGARLIRLKEVQCRVGLSRSTIYRWMAEGTFPKPVRLGGHAVAWVLSDIDQWILQRIP